MKDKTYIGIAKKFLRGTVCMAVGVAFAILLIPLGLLYTAICMVWELADYLVKKTEGS